jgi:holliday junction DNA helicase RuvA
MIRYLRGKVVDKIRTQLVIDVQGVGYGVFVTPKTVTITPLGHDITCYITESIREDAHDLYGFMTTDERDMFELLRKVSGIGPKAALALLGFYTPFELMNILQSSDIDRLSLVSGIGKKMASKIIVELKDRTGLPTALSSPDSADAETVTALQSLGYTSAEINQILIKVPVSLTQSDEKITWILQHLGE